MRDRFIYKERKEGWMMTFLKVLMTNFFSKCVVSNQIETFFIPFLWVHGK